MKFLIGSTTLVFIIGIYIAKQCIPVWTSDIILLLLTLPVGYAIIVSWIRETWLHREGFFKPMDDTHFW